MRYVVIDTETTGLPLYARKGEPPPAADAPGQPRLCSFTALPLDDDMNVIEDQVLSTLIAPPIVKGEYEWEVSEGANKVNGLTANKCFVDGIPVAEVLRVYSQYIEDGWIVVAHNAQFDTKILRGELRREGMADLFDKTLNICTMDACQDICQIVPSNKMMASGRPVYKKPKLMEAYVHFHGEEFADGHTSGADARACAALLRKLHELGKVPEPRILYAKSRVDA